MTQLTNNENNDNNFHDTDSNGTWIFTMQQSG